MDITNQLLDEIIDCLKNSDAYPVELAEYTKMKSIDDAPVFVWRVLYIL